MIELLEFLGLLVVVTVVGLGGGYGSAWLLDQIMDYINTRRKK